MIQIRDPITGKIISYPSIRGKSAYEYAVDGGYKGTEEDFIKLMAYDVVSEINKLSEYNEATFVKKGEVSGSSDMSVVDDGQGNLTFGTDVDTIISTDAKNSGYNNTNSGLSATNVQDAIDELTNSNTIFNVELEKIKTICSLINIVNGNLEIQVGDAILFWNEEKQALQIKYI